VQLYDPATAYTAFETRAELVAALLHREHQRGLEQLRAAIPDDLATPGPTGTHAAAVSAFLAAALDNPTRWRQILSVPDSAPPECRDSLRPARSSILGQSEAPAKAASRSTHGLARLGPTLLGHTMLSFAELLGRLAVNDPDTFSRARLESCAAASCKR
jgi:hypothetical protein